MTKNTPGPWRAIKLAEGTMWGVCAQIEGYGDTFITTTMLDYIGPGADTNEANARLVAAAPDAHEILESIHEFFRDGGPVNPSAMFDETHTYKQAVEAYLAKATGVEVAHV